MEVDDATVKLISSDGVAFSVPISAANESDFVADAMRDVDEDDSVIEVSVDRVNSEVLEKVIDFCKHLQVEKMSEIAQPLKSSVLADAVQPEWYANFVDVDQKMLFQLILAANYMRIDKLTDLAFAKVASCIKDKTREDILDIFKIQKDFTADEVEKIFGGEA